MQMIVFLNQYLILESCHINSRKIVMIVQRVPIDPIPVSPTVNVLCECDAFVSINEPFSVPKFYLGHHITFSRYVSLDSPWM